MKMFDYNFPAFIADVEKIQTPHPDVWQDLQKLCDTMAAWIQNDIPVHEWPHTKASASGGKKCHYLTTKLRIKGTKGRAFRVFYAYYPKNQYFKFIELYRRSKQDTFAQNRLDNFEQYTI